MLSSSPIVPVILAGGSGTRLWPISRDSLPKQFQALIGDKTMYQETLERVSDRSLFAAPIVFTHEDFRFFARRQASDIGVDVKVVLEPVRRDSGPALIAAAMIAQRLAGDNCLVLALAADHVVLDNDVFTDACRTAALGAAKGSIVTFGITPTEPSTAYGYIRPGALDDDSGVYSVASFVEKPDAATAQRYISEGYLWNSGNFMFPAGLLIEEATRFEPAIVEAVQAAVEGAVDDLGFIRLDTTAFSSSPSKSFDYAVMERTKRAAVVEGKFRWSDIGSWDAIRDISKSDDAGNVTRGPVALYDSHKDRKSVV